MPWTAVVGAVASGVVSNVMSDGGGGGGGGPAGAAAAADPFASQRPAYMDMLQKFMTQGFTPTDPSYKFRMDQGMQALGRTQAAGGLTGSGRAMTEAMEFGQGLASTEYGNQFSRLARLAGADVGSPSSAAQALMGGWSSQQQGMNAFSGAVGNAVSKTNWGNVLGGGTGSGGDGSAVWGGSNDYGSLSQMGNMGADFITPGA